MPQQWDHRRIILTCPHLPPSDSTLFGFELIESLNRTRKPRRSLIWTTILILTLLHQLFLLDQWAPTWWSSTESPWHSDGSKGMWHSECVDAMMKCGICLMLQWINFCPSERRRLPSWLHWWLGWTQKDSYFFFKNNRNMNWNKNMADFVKKGAVAGP